MFLSQFSSLPSLPFWEIYSPSGARILGSIPWQGLLGSGYEKYKNGSLEIRKVAKSLTKEGLCRYFWTPPLLDLTDALQKILPNLFPGCVRVLGVSESSFPLEVGQDCQNLDTSDIRPNFLSLVNSLTFHTKEFFERDKDQIGEVFCKQPNEPENLLTILTNDPRSVEAYGIANHPMLASVANFRVGLTLRADLSKKQIFKCAEALCSGRTSGLDFEVHRFITLSHDAGDLLNKPS